MAFEVRPADPSTIASGENPPMGAFTEGDWRGIIRLAQEHGFDPHNQYGHLMYPERGEVHDLDIAASQELAVALSEVLKKEVAPYSEAQLEGNESEKKSWVYTPEYGWKYVPVIPVSLHNTPELYVGWVHVRQLGELAENGPMKITRIDDPTPEG